MIVLIRFTGYSWNGRDLPSKERYGQDCGLRAGDLAATRARRRSSVRARSLPHARTRFSNLQGIRPIRQIHVQHQDGVSGNG